MRMTYLQTHEDLLRNMCLNYMMTDDEQNSTTKVNTVDIKMGGGEKAGLRYRTITDCVVNLYSFLWKCCSYSANQEIQYPYETRRIITTLPNFRYWILTGTSSI